MGERCLLGKFYRKLQEYCNLEANVFGANENHFRACIYIIVRACPEGLSAKICFLCSLKLLNIITFSIKIKFDCLL